MTGARGRHNLVAKSLGRLSRKKVAPVKREGGRAVSIDNDENLSWPKEKILHKTIHIGRTLSVVFVGDERRIFLPRILVPV